MRRKSKKKLLRILALVLATYAALVVVLSLAYLAVPPISTLMLARWLTWQHVAYAPVPLERVSPHLVRMVMRAEDSHFCTHHGIDWNSLEQTIEEAAADIRTRGASTISMQVTKNLFLWPQASYIRKAVEMPLTLYLEVLWPKSRILEVYLSIAEWGNGIFGAEAASQAYFHKPASKLTLHESALLAAALPNPRQRNPQKPSPYHRRYARLLENAVDEYMDMTCVQ